MGHRLSKIYTRTGDQGTTGLSNGARIDKDSPRIEAMGDVDELNSAIGLVLACDLRESVRHCLIEIQHKLFDLGGELSMPGFETIRPEDVTAVEQDIETFNADLPYLREFILPGGGQSAAACHLARAICRRAERRLVTLSRHEDVNPQSRIYLNRLSDLLFVLCRILARDGGGTEVLWHHDRQRRRMERP